MENETNTASITTQELAIHSPKKAPVPSFSFKAIAILSLLMVTALFLIVGVAWKKFLVAQRQLIYVEKQLILQQKKAQNLTQQMAKLQSLTSAQQLELAQNNGEIQRLLQQNPNYRVTQTLAEIEHLIQEANLNLNYSNNIPAAIALLHAADERAKTLTLAGITELRQRLSTTMTALQLLPVVDMDGLLARLHGLQQQIEQTALFSAPKGGQKVLSAATSKEDQAKDWRAGLTSTWEALQKMIVIRHRSEPVIPLIAPEQHVYLKQTLQLQLQQAALAAMQRHDQVYQSSLQQAITWIQQYYAANASASTGIIAILRDLQKIVLKPSIPDLMPILQMVDQLQQQQTITPSAQPALKKGQDRSAQVAGAK